MHIDCDAQRSAVLFGRLVVHRIQQTADHERPQALFRPVGTGPTWLEAMLSVTKATIQNQ